MAFVFYDTETTGTSTSFDQILQFAAIQTDDDLNEIERFEIRCRLLPHVVPSPGAMVVTGATVATMIDPSLPSHYEMVRAIRDKLLSWSPAIFFGYNSMDFDEHLFRQALYQTLHDPFLTNKGGNCRGDILKCVRAASVFAPDAIAIPLSDKGKPSFKLDRLAPFNGFAHKNAHDALADVEATIYVARQLRDQCAELWSSLLRFTNKTAAIDYLNEEPVLALSEAYFGSTYTYYVTFLGQHAAKAGIHAIFDLSVDPDDVAILSNEELIARLGVQPKPVRSMRVNAHPLFIPLDMAQETVMPAVPEDELLRRAERLASDDDFRKRLLEAWSQSGKPTETSQHVEEQIYDGFMSRDDEAVLTDFHARPWEARLPLVNKLKDKRLRKIAYRLMHNERRDLLPKHVLVEIEAGIAERMLSTSGDEKWNTIAKAMKEIGVLLSERMDMAVPLLELQEFLSSLRDSKSRPHPQTT
jgi:exodeoxyribonuclease I